MRMSTLFGRTRREVAGQFSPGRRLLIQAGYIRLLKGGTFAELPLGVRLREAMTRCLLGALPAEAAQPVGLTWSVQPIAEAPFTTPLAALAELARQEVESYRQLPATLYELVPRSDRSEAPSVGLNVYLLAASEVSAWDGYRERLEALGKAVRRMGLPTVRVVEADSGLPDTAQAHALAVLAPFGDRPVAICPSCGFAAAHEVAPFQHPSPPQEPQRPLEKVATPGTNTIRLLAEFLSIPETRTAKVVFYMARWPAEEQEKLVMALVRGDMGVSEAKVRRALNALTLRPAEPSEIEAVGAVPGFASPIGIQRDHVVVVVDELVARSPNLVAGANEADFHYINVNAGRDYEPDTVADIALAPAKAPCAACGTPLAVEPAVIVGQGVLLRAGASWPPSVLFVDADGARRPVWSGWCHVSVTALVECLAEFHHDEQGLTWPATVAPFHVHLIELGPDPEVTEVAGRIYQDLLTAGLDVLYDDREARAGVKFHDADLIGVPIHVAVGRRALQQGGVEVKIRATGEREIVPHADVVTTVRRWLERELRREG